MGRIFENVFYEIKKWATKDHLTRALILVVAAAVAITLLNRFILKPRRGINLSHLLTIEYSGFDTYGEAKLIVDEEGLKETLKAYPKANGHTYQFELDKSKNLSNDDTLWVRIFEDGKEITSQTVLDKIEGDKEFIAAQQKIDDENVMEFKESELEAENGLATIPDLKTATPSAVPTETIEPKEEEEEEGRTKSETTQSRSEFIRFQDKSFRVKGLTECKLYTKEEIFSGINLEFTGASPRMAVRVANKSEDPNLSFITFDVDKKDHIRNGDLLTFTPTWDEETGRRVGFRVPEMQLRYTVGEHDKYIASAKALAQDQMRDILLSSASSITGSLKGKNLTLNGEPIMFSEIKDLQIRKVYFLRTGSEDAHILSDTYNGMCMVFSFTGTQSFKDKKSEYTTTYENCYAAVMATNIEMKTDGTINKSNISINESSLVANSLNVPTTMVFASSSELYDKLLKPFEGYYLVDQVQLTIKEDVVKEISDTATQQNPTVSVPEDNAPEKENNTPDENAQPAPEEETEEEEEEIIFSVN